MYIADKVYCSKCCPTNYTLIKRRKPKTSIVTNVLTKEKLTDLYCHHKKSLEDIAKEHNCTRQMVKLLMVKYDLPRRKRSEARVLAIKNGKFSAFEYDDINDSFFSKWSPEMAWVLGLLFTDGNVQRTKSSLRVSIASVDYDLLCNVRTLLGSTRAIKKNVQSYDKSKFIYSFVFFREKMRDDLHKLGLVERKSLVMQFPEVPERYIRHFIRGCWDGDGSIYLSAGKLRASYVCGSFDFIKTLGDELYKIGIYRKILHGYMNSINATLRSQYPNGQYPLKIHIEKRSKTPSYYLKIDSRENLSKLFYFFYAGIDESLYLKRKYNVFVEGLSLNIDDITKLKDLNEKELSISQEISSKISSEDKEEHVKKIIRNVQSEARVLAVNNAGGKLKCVKCNQIHEMMYVAEEIYCPNCISRTVGVVKK